MAWTLHRDVDPKLAASAISPYRPVKPTTTKDRVVLAATSTDLALGFTIASAASPGDALAVVVDGIVKAVAGASLGAGAEVGVASTNGVLGPISAASGTLAYSVGVSQDSAAAADTFSVRLRPRYLSGSP